MIDSLAISETLSALAHPSRVDVFKYLLAHHPKGLTASQLSQGVNIPPSTLSHHLREMTKGGVIERVADGQSTVTFLDVRRLTQIMTVLTQLCCSIEQTPESGPQ